MERVVAIGYQSGNGEIPRMLRRDGSANACRDDSEASAT